MHYSLGFCWLPHFAPHPVEHMRTQLSCPQHLSKTRVDGRKSLENLEIDEATLWVVEQNIFRVEAYSHHRQNIQFFSQKEHQTLFSVSFPISLQ